MPTEVWKQSHSLLTEFYHKISPTGNFKFGCTLLIPSTSFRFKRLRMPPERANNYNWVSFRERIKCHFICSCFWFPVQPVYSNRSVLYLLSGFSMNIPMTSLGLIGQNWIHKSNESFKIWSMTPTQDFSYTHWAFRMFLDMKKSISTFMFSIYYRQERSWCYFNIKF